MYPDLFAPEGTNKPTVAHEVMALLLALFDTLDRDGDGNLQMEEIVGFFVKVMDFVMRNGKLMQEMIAEAFCIQANGMFRMLWEKLGIKEVTKEQVPSLMQTVPIVLMSVVMEAQ